MAPLGDKPLSRPLCLPHPWELLQVVVMNLGPLRPNPESTILGKSAGSWVLVWRVRGGPQASPCREGSRQGEGFAPPELLSSEFKWCLYCCCHGDGWSAASGRTTQVGAPGLFPGRARLAGS